MKARVFITAGSQVSIFIDEGTLETSRGTVECFFARLAAQNMATEWDGKVEKHRHEQETAARIRGQLDRPGRRVHLARWLESNAVVCKTRHASRAREKADPCESVSDIG